MDRTWEYIDRLQTHECDIGPEATQLLFWEHINPNFYAVRGRKQPCSHAESKKQYNVSEKVRIGSKRSQHIKLTICLYEGKSTVPGAFSKAYLCDKRPGWLCFTSCDPRAQVLTQMTDSLSGGVERMSGVVADKNITVITLLF